MILMGDNKSSVTRVKLDNPLLENELKNIMREIGLKDNFKLEFRGYSSSYWGLYYPKDKKVVVYVLNSDGDYLPYKRIVFSALHEAIHHFQHEDPEFIRLNGIMHDAEFKRIEFEKKAVIRENYF